MASFSFSTELNKFFQCFKEGENSRTLSVPQNNTNSQQSSRNTGNSDVVILLNAQNCEFNIGLNKQSNVKKASVKNAEPEVITIDSSDEDDTRCEIQEHSVSQKSTNSTAGIIIKQEKTSESERKVMNRSVHREETHISELTKTSPTAVKSDEHETIIIDSSDEDENDSHSNETIETDPSDEQKSVFPSEWVKIKQENVPTSDAECKYTPLKKKPCPPNLSKNIPEKVVDPCRFCGKVATKRFKNRLKNSSVCNCSAVSKNTLNSARIGSSSVSVDVSGTSIQGKGKHSRRRFENSYHIGNKNRFACENCSLIFTKNSKLQIHREFNCKGTESSKLVCKICSKHYAGPCSLMQHMTGVHNTKISYIDACRTQRIRSEKIGRSDAVSNLTSDSDSLSLKKSSATLKNIYRHKQPIKDLRATRLMKFFIQAGYFTSSIKCPICQKQFYVISNLKIHMRWHTKEKPFSCRKCHKEFFTIAAVKNHVVYNCRKRLDTSYTGLKYSSGSKASGIENQSSLEVQSKSTNNSNKYNRKLGVSRNRKVDINNSCNWKISISAPVCEICGSSFANDEYLKEHKKHHCKSDEITEKRIVCKFCKLSFSREMNLKHHLKFNCKYTRGSGNACDESETSNISERRQYTCHNCQKSYEGLRYLLRHKRHHCPVSKVKNNKVSEFKNQESCIKKYAVKQGSKTFYVCPYCEKKVISQNYLILHMSMHTNNSKYRCERCGISYRHKSSYNSHIRICKISKCIAQTSERSTKSVKNYVIPPQKSYKCDKCFKSFRTAGNYSSHKMYYCKQFKNTISITESGISPKKVSFMCKLCKRNFEQPSWLKQHTDAVHTEFKAICNSCNNTFDDFHGLKQHLIREPRLGYICSKSKSTNFSKSNDEGTNSRESMIENIFSCGACNGKFPSIPTLVQHMQQDHLTKE